MISIVQDFPEAPRGPDPQKPPSAPHGVLSGYKKAKNWAWVQEEPENMGTWRFVRRQLKSLTGKQIAYIGRKASPSPTSGISTVYKKQQAAIIEEAIGPPKE